MRLTNSVTLPSHIVCLGLGTGEQSATKGELQHQIILGFM